MRQPRRAATLPVAFFRRPAEIVAADLIGKVVVSTVGGELTSGRIVETEAYLGYDDPASHGYLHRRNARNEALFGPPGLWYVYLSYGMHWCANLVCQGAGLASAVLLRALEPTDGLEVMRERRGAMPDRQLCSGPGRLCQALGINRELDGVPMSGGPVVVLQGESVASSSIAATSRIGITKAADWPLRFHLAGSEWTSRKEKSGRSRRSPAR
jgi:DNA-3-methyladenine glycosylase